MLTIWVHVVPGHLWGGEPLLERVCAVTVLIHGEQLLLRRSQRCEGVHHSLHPIGHYLCKAKRVDDYRKCKTKGKKKRKKLDDESAECKCIHAQWADMWDGSGEKHDDESINSRDIPGRFPFIPGHFRSANSPKSQLLLELQLTISFIVNESVNFFTINRSVGLFGL